MTISIRIIRRPRVIVRRDRGMTATAAVASERILAVVGLPGARGEPGPAYTPPDPGDITLTFENGLI